MSDEQGGFGLQSLAASIDPRIQGLQTLRDKSLTEANAGLPPLTREQQMSGILLSVLPILIGLAAKGKKGASIGAEAAQTGIRGFGGSIIEEGRRKQKMAADVYTNAQDELEKERQNKFSVEKEIGKQEAMDERKRKYGSGGVNVNIQNLPPAMLQDLTEGAGTVGQIEGVKNLIETNIPDWRSESYSSLEGVKKIAERKGTEFLFGNNEAAGQIKSSLQGVVLYYQSKNIKGNASDRDVGLVRDYAYGAGILPNSLPAIMNSLERMQGDIERHVRTFSAVSRSIMNAKGSEGAVADEIINVAKNKAPSQQIKMTEEEALEKGYSPNEIPLLKLRGFVF